MLLLQLVAEHQLTIRVLSLPAGLAVATPITIAALRPPGRPTCPAWLVRLVRVRPRRRARASIRPRHARRRGVRAGLPTEIRRHRTGRARTWPGTRSTRTTSPRSHALDDITDERDRRWRVANLIGRTGELTHAEMQQLLAAGREVP